MLTGEPRARETWVDLEREAVPGEVITESRGRLNLLRRQEDKVHSQ